jgi:nicotinamidase-related amidase
LNWTFVFQLQETPMPLTQIDPLAALVVIDMQKGIVALPTAHPIKEVIERIATLAQAFREQHLPVVLVNVAGRAPGRTDRAMKFSPPADWAELIPELKQQPSDYTVTKMQVGAFYGTSLDRILRRAGVTQVFVTGVASSMGVEKTATDAYDHGYHVGLITDAMTDLDAENHRHSVEKVFPKIGETASTDEVLAQLQQRAKGANRELEARTA